MGKPKRYDYVHRVVWKLTPGGPEVDAKRVLRKLVREAVLRIEQRQNTCHVCKVSMLPRETPPTCEDCGGCDDDKCDHLYRAAKKSNADRIARELIP